MKRVDRIMKMEECLDASSEAIAALEAALDKFDSARESYTRLVSYYESGQWIKDFEADEAGKLPPDLKRGVLSEDAVWNLLERYREASVRMLEFVKDDMLLH